MIEDVEGFRKAALAAGHSKSDVEAMIAKENSSSPSQSSKPQLSSIDELNKRIGADDWWHLPAAAAVGAGAAAGAKYLMGKDGSVGTAPPSTTMPSGSVAPQRIEPTFDIPAPGQTAVPQSAGQQTLTPQQALQRMQGAVPPAQQPTVAPQAPVAQQAPVAASQPPAPVAPGPAANPLPIDSAPAQTPQNPTPNLPGTTAAPTTPVDNGIKTRVRRTQAQIAEQAAQLAKNAPEGMIPNYPKGVNKMGEDVIGKSGYNWFASQGGTQDAWERLYGRTNQTYPNVVSDVKGGLLEVPPPPEGKKGGAFGRPQYVPDYIKGGISPGMAVNVAGNALGAAELIKAYRQGKQTGDWSNFGLGAIGQVLANANPTAALAYALMSPGTLNAGENEWLKKRDAAMSDPEVLRKYSSYLSKQSIKGSVPPR